MFYNYVLNFCSRLSVNLPVSLVWPVPVNSVLKIWKEALSLFLTVAFSDHSLEHQSLTHHNPQSWECTALLTDQLPSTAKLR